MKPRIVLCGLTKDINPSLYSCPHQQRGLVPSGFVQSAHWKLNSILVFCLLLKLFICVRRTVTHYRPHVLIEFQYCPPMHLHYVKSYLIHIYLIIATIGAHERKHNKKDFHQDCLHHLGSQMPPSPRITNFEEKEHASVNLMLIA